MLISSSDMTKLVMSSGTGVAVGVGVSVGVGVLVGVDGTDVRLGGTGVDVGVFGCGVSVGSVVGVEVGPGSGRDPAL